MLAVLSYKDLMDNNYNYIKTYTTSQVLEQ